MTGKIVICDQCKKEERNPYPKILFNCSRWDGWIKVVLDRENYNTFDLCSMKCLKDFAEGKNAANPKT